MSKRSEKIRVHYNCAVYFQGERAGSGVPDIFSAWKQEGWQRPIIEEQYAPDRTILTLPLLEEIRDRKPAIKNNNMKISKKMQKQHETILQYMKVGKEYRLIDFCELLELKGSRTKEILKKLADIGKIELLGENKDRRYRKIP